MTNEEILLLRSLANQINEPLDSFNMKAVFTQAKRHGVLPLCYENLNQSQDFCSEKYVVVQSKVFSIVFSQVKRTESFRKIYRTILENGIKPLVLKGIICRQLYGDLCDHRPSGDEDILVRKEDYFHLAEILEENGYVAEEKVTPKTLSGKQEITFRNPNGLNIEVHLNIIGTENKRRRKMNKYFDNAFDKAIVIEIEGQKYYTLNYTENYIYLFYHLFKHFAMTGVGLRQLLDLFKFAEAYGEKIDWSAVHEAIVAINAHNLYGDLVEIGNQYWGFSLSNPFGRRHPERLLDDIFFSGAYGNNTSEQRGSKVKVMAAIETEGGNLKLRMIFPTIEAMREHYTVLYNHPYLLPVMWVVRIARYVFRSKTGKTYDVSKSEQIADRKIKLLKDYGII